MRKLAFALAVMAAAVVLFFLWIARLPPFDGLPEPEVLAIEELRVEQEAVQVSGTAHYPLKVSYEVSGRFGRPATTRWLFPLFDHQDTAGRHVVAMISSLQQPERLVAYEDMTVVGEARKPRVAVTAGVERAFLVAGYTFDDAYVLVVEYAGE